MVIKVIRPLSIALAGEPKTGKSTIGAMIIKRYGGLICDFSRVNQSGGLDGSTVKYNTAISQAKEINGVTYKEVGEAWTAAHKNNIDDNYRLILNWQDFENVIAEARILSNDVLQKKIWLVIDDSVAMRWHKALDVAKRLGHKSIVQKDWTIATVELKLTISSLSKDFNLLIINQMIDEYHEYESQEGDNKTVKEKQKSGVKVPLWIPNGLDYLVDGMVHIEIDKSQRPYKQYLVIDGGRCIWICDDNFSPKVDQVTPEMIMKSLSIEEDRL